MKQYYLICLGLISMILVACHSGDLQVEKEWRYYHGDLAGNQYSFLSQINQSNVDKLELAWTYEIRSEEATSTLKCNPLMVHGRVYAVTSDKNLVALNPETGDELWYLNFHHLDSIGRPGNARGLQYWENGDDRRIFYVYADHLYAVNAEDGTLVDGFGERGRICFRTGLNIDSDLIIRMTTPGVIYQNFLIVGSMVSEKWPAAPGHIRAFDVITGELVWMFHTIPQPGEFGYETWPEDAYQYVGGANSWAGMSLDEERGIVYIPTASPTFDFYGANRIGQNLFSDCVLALDAKTGKRIWHYQTIRHDLWDRDLPCAPKLIQSKYHGTLKDLVVQPTKQGHLFIFDRETGEPIFDINEVPAPPSRIQGEHAWLKQPLPTWPPPFTRQVFSEDLITDISPEANAFVREKRARLQTQIFSPPDTVGVVLQPDFGGGAGWGGAAVAEDRRIMVINANDFPGILQLVNQENKRSTQASSGSDLYQIHCAACHGKKREGLHLYPPLTRVMEKYPRKEIMDIVSQGMGLMPAFSFLSKEEKEAIIAFLAGEEASLPSTLSSAPTQQAKLKYAHRGNLVFTDEDGYPGIKPPWATLTAYDIDTWEIKWQKPLGTHEEITKPDGPLTGTKTLGGPIATAGGLVFIASTADRYIRAFDVETGETLWQYQLPGNGLATPATYWWKGKQYLIIAVSGDEVKGIMSQYMAFRLPTT
ncbi:MAG: PQQ-binding-like beta-propeller repeat protein [Bacteroidota bacterium]